MVDAVKDTVYKLFPCERIILTFMQKITRGAVEVTMDGKTEVYGDAAANATRRVTLNIKNKRFFRRVVAKSDIGMGESYMDGDWETNDLPGLFEVLINNMTTDSAVIKGSPVMSSVMSSTTGLMRWLWRNTPRVSHENVKAHYDIGNDFYQLMLDREHMQYTCALFAHPSDTLEQAQLNKMHLVINKAELNKDDLVLEMGCGWGGLAIEAARKVGCRVMAVNLSGEQIAYAQKRAKDLGIADRATFQQMDYRDVEGTQKFDKIISVGMMEHVGHYDLGTFFETADRLLKPNGILVIHMITFLDQGYNKYIKEMDFCKKYIFPGCCIPSVTALQNAMTTRSRFVTQHLENLSANYALTLHEWRKNYLANIEEVKALGYDETFQRMWDFYLCYSEAAFRTNHLGLTQMVLKRPSIDDPYKPGRPSASIVPL